MAFAEYDRHDGLGLAALVRSREVSASELLEEAIARAERVNPRLNAIVTPMYDLARRRAREVSTDGAFAGVPFLLKDLGTAAYAGVRHTGGTRMYRGYVPDEHGELTRRYEAAGVVVLGMTNTPELGVLPITESELHGPAHNPWRHGVTPGGSSGGSAAAVAAGIVPLAHGGDGGGSIRIPAACCGLFGLKPSRSRLPLGPHASEGFFGFSVEHVLTHTVRDSAAMLDATAGPEPHSIFHAAPGSGFLAALSAPKERLRIAFTSDPLLPAERNAEATRAVEHAARLLEGLGHEVVEARPRVNASTFARAFFYQFAVGVASELAWAERLHHRPMGPSDVERTTWLLALAGRSIAAPDFANARRTLFEEARSVMGFFDTQDIFLCPTLGRPPLRHGALEPEGMEAAIQGVAAVFGTPAIFKVRGLLDRAAERAYAFAPYTPVFNVTGQPSASVPLSMTEDGLPMGVMITAGMGQEGRLLRVAGELEEACPWRDRRPPIHAGR